MILAAGASRRMGPGRNKMLLRLEGESLVHRAARRAAGAGLAPVVVVLGAEAERVRAELADLPCDLALNPDFTGPTSGSLHRGLERIPGAVGAAVVTTARGSDAPLVVSRYGEVTAPPLLFRRALFGELLAWTGEGCGKTVVQRHRGEAAFVDWPHAALTDIDTPDDFAAAEALIARHNTPM